MNELLLTPEERNKVRGKRTYLSRDSFEDELLQAQLNKVLKWLDAPCTEHKTGTVEIGDTKMQLSRRHCSDCWQRVIVPE